MPLKILLIISYLLLVGCETTSEYSYNQKVIYKPGDNLISDYFQIEGERYQVTYDLYQQKKTYSRNEISIQIEKDESGSWAISENMGPWRPGIEVFRIDLAKKRITVDYYGRASEDTNISKLSDQGGRDYIEINCYSTWGGFEGVENNSYDPCYSEFFPPHTLMSISTNLAAAAILGGLNCIMGACSSYFTSFDASKAASTIHSLELITKAKEIKNPSLIKNKLNEKGSIRIVSEKDLEIGILKKEIQKTRTQLEREKKVRQDAEKEADDLKKQLDKNKNELRNPKIKDSIEGLKQIDSGSGFYIDSNSIITSLHVVKSCDVIFVSMNSEERKTAGIIQSDIVNDIALLKSSNNKISKYVAAIEPEMKAVNMGEKIYVAGYPFAQKLNTGLNFTSGEVSALFGPNKNSSELQVSAPIQPGNSGGPVINRFGNVIGIVSNTANSLKLQKNGALPQNINFAKNRNTISAFLDASSASYKLGDSRKELSIKELTTSAKEYVVQVGCFRSLPD